MRSIESWNTPQVDALTAGDPAGVTLSDQLFVERGSIAVHATDAPSLATEFTARIFWLGRTPLAAGKRYKLKLVTQEVECEIKTLEEVIDASTVQTIPNADSVRTNDAARVVIHARRPVAVDLFERVPTLGRLVLVDGFDVAGGGIVVDVPERFAAANVVADAGVNADVSQVARGERHLRHGHRGAVVWLTGVPGSGKTTLAQVARAPALRTAHSGVRARRRQHPAGLELGPWRVRFRTRREHAPRRGSGEAVRGSSGRVCIVSFTSPHARRARARRSAMDTEDGPRIPFLEAYLSSTNDASSQYEPPEHPEVTLAESMPRSTNASTGCSSTDAADSVMTTDHPAFQSTDFQPVSGRCDQCTVSACGSAVQPCLRRRYETAHRSSSAPPPRADRLDQRPARARRRRPAVPANLLQCADLSAALTSVVNQDTRLRDWANLGRYRDANKSLRAADAVFMGDSITDFWQQPRFGGFFPGKNYVDRGISAQTTSQMLLRLRADVIALKPKVVVILAGTNDIAGNTGPMTTKTSRTTWRRWPSWRRPTASRSCCRASLRSARTTSPTGRRPQTTRRPVARVKAINDWMKLYAAAHKHVYLDYYSAMIDNTGMLKTEFSDDDLHPNAAGYAAMAPLAEAAIAQALR